jgi:hypothetical protein
LRIELPVSHPTATPVEGDKRKWCMYTIFRDYSLTFFQMASCCRRRQYGEEREGERGEGERKRERERERKRVSE